MNSRDSGYRSDVQNAPWSIESLKSEVDSALSQYVEKSCASLTAIGPELEAVAAALRTFTLTSGKRFRPLLATLGYLATGEQLTPAAFTTLSSLELVHVCALIHDDVMDQSDTRRGEPTIHRLFESQHRSERLQGSSENYGLASSILIGDLALVWAAHMSRSGGQEISDLERFLAIYDEMQSELMAGQFLDIHEQALGTYSAERSLKVARYKSAKYSIERPLHCGIALALPQDGERAELLSSHLSSFGLPLGEAFQLRDDLLGVFGTEAETGKPVGDDLREGKRTVLLAYAYENATSVQRELFDEKIGLSSLSQSEILHLQEEIIATGAVEKLEALISRLTDESLQSLTAAPIDSSACALLEDVAIRVTRRKS